MPEVIKRTNVATGEVTEMVAGLPLAVGDLFRPIGRAMTFRVVETREVCGIDSVLGHSVCGRYQTGGRVADMVRLAA